MKSKPSELTVYIPILFPDIDELVKGTGLKADKIRILLHQMYLSKLSQSGYSDRLKEHPFNYIFNDGYVALHSSLLVKLLSKRYKTYLNFLEERNLVTVRMSTSSKAAYTPGHTSKHYAIRNDLLHARGEIRHFRKEVITDYSTIKAVMITRDNYSHLSNRGLREAKMTITHQSLLKMEKTVRFNVEAAESWLKQIMTGIIVEKDFEAEDLMHSGMEVELMQLINDGSHFNSKVDVFGERIYTPLKRVARYMRKFMYFKNIPNVELACIDISNSQLFFSTLLADKKIIQEIIPEFLPIAEFSEYYSKQSDFKRYKEACINGTIYEEWMRVACHTDRNAAKKQLIQILFCRNNAKMPSIKIFREQFPSVAKFFREIKSLKEDALPFITSTYIDKNGRFKTDSYHCNLSCATQRLESRIFIRNIGQYLVGNGINPFFTIHDSIYFPKHLTEKVQDGIITKLKLMGVEHPKLKISNP